MSFEVVKRLVEAPNGVLTNFTTSTPYVAGSFRLVRNGQMYEADDAIFGWTEVDESEIQLLEAPDTGEVLQGFYTEQRSEGSPFDPAGVLP